MPIAQQLGRSQSLLIRKITTRQPLFKLDVKSQALPGRNVTFEEALPYHYYIHTETPRSRLPDSNYHSQWCDGVQDMNGAFSKTFCHVKFDNWTKRILTIVLLTHFGTGNRAAGGHDGDDGSGDLHC